MSNDVSNLLCRVGVEVEDWGSVCSEVVVAGKIYVGGSKGCGWLGWDRKLESDGRQHGEDVRVVGGNAGGVVEGGNGADSDWSVVR